jgi:peptidyl-prolyl cis-trans isomerase B (cyclophilin B)
MTRIVMAMAMVLASVVLWPATAQVKPGPAARAAGPVMVLETAKGTVEIQLFQAEAPKSVERILALVKSNFYRGLRMHRVLPSLVQFGDPATRDMSRRNDWGSGGSGKIIGVAELSKKRTHRPGTVGLAHSGDARLADSQLYIMKTASPGLDSKHAIVGQVTKGMDVVAKLKETDMIKAVSLKVP